MIGLNGKTLEVKRFPDGTVNMRDVEICTDGTGNVVSWFYENDSEFLPMYYLSRYIRDRNVGRLELFLPYIPNARMDRVKNRGEIFTLKYFCDLVNSLCFDKVFVLDPHSNVSLALINRVCQLDVFELIRKTICDISSDNLLLFYPDEGAMKRYSGALTEFPYCYGVKRRNWETGAIEGLDVFGDTKRIDGADILIIDDICCKGGTFYHSAKKLRTLGANKIYLFVSHCENSIFTGDFYGLNLLECGLIRGVFTTNSLLHKADPKIVISELNDRAENR